MMSKKPPSQRTFVEISVTVAASSISVILGFLVAVGMFVEELLKGKIKRMWKEYFLLMIKLIVLLLYPSVILILSKYPDRFITKILFDVDPQPLDGFGVALAIFLIHMSVNARLFKVRDEWCGR